MADGRRQAGPLSNHGDSSFHVADTCVQCAEQAFKAGTLSEAAKMLVEQEVATGDVKAEDWDHVCERWEALLEAPTPWAANVATRGLKSELFDKERWDAVAPQYMFTALLLKFASCEEQFAALLGLLEVGGARARTEVFVEAEDPVWGCNAPGAVMRDRLLALEGGLTAARVAEEVRALGGQNKLGVALGWVVETIKWVTVDERGELFHTHGLFADVVLERECPCGSLVDLVVLNGDVGVAAGPGAMEAQAGGGRAMETQAVEAPAAGGGAMETQAAGAPTAGGGAMEEAQAVENEADGAYAAALKRHRSCA